MATYCATSPDGVFPLFKLNTDTSKHEYVGLCALEIKTRGTENTTDALIEQVLTTGSWTECTTDTVDFKIAVPDGTYCTQLVQHATALDLNRVLMVYSLPGAVIKKIVLVTVPQVHRGKLFSLEQQLAQRYMPFAFGATTLHDIRYPKHWRGLFRRVWLRTRT